MILSTSLLRFRCEGVGVDLFDRDGVPRCSSDRVFLAVVLGSVAAVDGSTVLSFSCGGLFNPAVRCLVDYRETLDWVLNRRRGRGFCNIPFPSSNRVVGPE